METISDFITDNNYVRLLVTNSSSTEVPMQDSEAGAGEGLIFPGVLFLILNGFLNGCFGDIMMKLFSQLFRTGKCTKKDFNFLLIFLLSWFVPILVGYLILGILGACCLGFVDVVLPHTFWAIYYNRYNEDVQAIPCCSCFRSNPVPDDSNEANTLEVPVGSADVVNENTESDESNNNKIKELLILKKVVDQGDFLNGKDSARSFRFNHPKSDLVIERRHKANWLHKKFRVAPPSSNVSTNSVQLCAICLEDYQVGEDIGWSRNPLCYHAFHKDCILKSLKADESCPICRNLYYIADEEEGRDPPGEGP
jgi:hypothetical protein